MDEDTTRIDSDLNTYSAPILRSSRLMLSLLLLVEILLIPSAILIFDLHPALTLILVLEYSMTLACFTSAAETKLKQLKFSIQMKLIAVILTHVAAIMYLCYRTPHETLEIFMEAIQARVIHLKLSEVIIYTLYFILKVATIASVTRSVSSIKNYSKNLEKNSAGNADTMQMTEQLPMYYQPMQQPELAVPVWHLQTTYQHPIVVQYVYSNYADTNWM